MAFRNQCFLASVILLLEVSCCFGEQDLIYCEPDNCYDILGVQPTATTQEIRKAYRHLSKTLHPDVNKAKGAAETFRIIALANEILSNKDERAEYDYYLKHPEEAFYNKMRFYRRRYAPKTDARLVVFGFIAFVSVVQYFVKEMATERLEQANLNGASMKNKKKAKKSSKEVLAKLEAEVTEELARNIDIEGGYKNPTFRDLLFCKVVILPYTIATYLMWHGDWTYRHSIKSEPYSDDEKIYLISRQLGTSSEALKANIPAEELEEMIERECWVRANLDRFQEEQMMRKHPGAYKRYKRWVKKTQ
mmetsp:Transcript_29172/g.36125  ORF Transcript_29172/g.36125 Transcript_29172/m.36125 type:complete len:305 (+) Transcript_29172:451-1365(+)